MTLPKSNLETLLDVTKIKAKGIGYALYKGKFDANEALKLLQQTVDEMRKLEEEISNYEYEESLRDSKL